MAEIESAWPQFPGYQIAWTPFGSMVRAWHDDTLLAESSGAVRLAETDHLDRVYFPREDVILEHFARSDHRSICPFKGEASYWTLTSADPPIEDLIWDYPSPLEEVAGLENFVGVYHERLRVEVDEPWPGDDQDVHRSRKFPAWGTAQELVDLMDVQPIEPGVFRAASRPILVPKWGPSAGGRNVVEGGQLLGASIVAAAKAEPTKRVIHASAIFIRPASFDDPIEVAVDVLHSGRTFATIETRLTQGSKLVSTATILLDAGSEGLISHSDPIPDLAPPSTASRVDMGVIGRELRAADDAYNADPDRVGPPHIDVWCRFADAPTSLALRQALLSQSTTHWTLAAAMRPHAGISEASAHLGISTGIMSATIDFHDDFDLTDWLLYRTTSHHAGHGLAHGQGIVHTPGGQIAATFSVNGSVRPFAIDPATLGLDGTNAM